MNFNVSCVLKYFSALIVLVGFSAFAEVLNVECSEGGCLKEGWTISAQNGRVLSQVECLNSSCENEGWDNWTWNNQDTQIQCSEGGCFNEGWTEVTPRGNVLAQTHCEKDHAPGDGTSKASCGQYGWVSYFGRTGTLTTQCLGGDCFRVGWESFLNGRKTVRVLCKAGGCFKNGWTIYQ